MVAGYRLHKRGTDLIGSLLLGLYTDDGELAMAGVIGAFPMARRRELFGELQPLVTSFEGHPWDWGAWQREAEAEGRAWRGSTSSRWNPGKELSFTPLRPERVVEVRYDHLEGRRFRHTAQFQRWRPDRDPPLLHLRPARGDDQLRPRRGPGDHNDLTVDLSPHWQGSMTCRGA